MTDKSRKEALINEYSAKGKEFVDNKYDEVKSLMDKYVNAIDEKGVITETGDPVFGKTASEAMAKSTELTVEFAALREVKNTLDKAEAYKKLAESRTEAGDILTPAKSNLDEQLIASLKNVTGSKGRNIHDAMKEAVDEGRISFDLSNNNRNKTSVSFGEDKNEKFNLLMNVFTHKPAFGGNAGSGSWESEILRTGRIQVAPVVTQDVLDIVPTLMLGRAGLRYMEEVSVNADNPDSTSPTNSVAVRQEGGRVAEQDLSYIERTVALKNVGVRMVITDEISNDEPELIAFVTGRLGRLLRKFTGSQLMIGDGASNNINGFQSYTASAQFAVAATNPGFTTASLGTTRYGNNTNRPNIPVYTAPATAATNASNTLVEMYKAATRIEDVGGENPDYVVAKSGTIASIFTAQDSNNNFIFPQNGFAPNMIPLLGLPAVKSSDIANGRVLIGSFADNCNLGIVGGLNAEMGYDGQDFSTFQRTMRMGWRGNLAVYHPQAFVWVNRVIQ